MIIIGQILKPQGIKGELKVLPITDDVTRFQRLKEVLVDNTSFPVVSARIHENFVYLKLLGVEDRDEAEKLVGKQLSVERKDAIRLPKGRYFIDDLIGCTVYVGSVEIGNVKRIDNFGSADVYTVVGDRTVMFPLLKDLVTEILPDEGKIVLDEKRFAEVAVYED